MSQNKPYSIVVESWKYQPNPGYGVSKPRLDPDIQSARERVWRISDPTPSPKTSRQIICYVQLEFEIEEILI